jgi:N-acetylmuramoyl-L-alanine amidase
VCDDLTWRSLLEAGFTLGDRPLYLRHPPLRGDDVLALQAALSGLGFDAGRTDGIFGPATAQALEAFQRNSGLATDAVCGSSTVAALRRLGHREAPSVAAVREAEALRGTAARAGTIGVGHDEAGRALAAQLVDLLVGPGILAVRIDAPPARAPAEANARRVDVYLHVEVGDEPLLAFYASPGYVSPGGRLLAQLIAAELTEQDVASPAPAPQGLRSPILRDTSMPAVVWRVDARVEPTAGARAGARALRQWCVTSGT